MDFLLLIQAFVISIRTTLKSFFFIRVTQILGKFSDFFRFFFNTSDKAYLGLHYSFFGNWIYSKWYAKLGMVSCFKTIKVATFLKFQLIFSDLLATNISQKIWISNNFSLYFLVYYNFQSVLWKYLSSIPIFCPTLRKMDIFNTFGGSS